MSDETMEEPPAEEEEEDIDLETVYVYAGIIITIVILTPFLSRLPRTRGKNLTYQAAFFVTAGLHLWFVPEFIQDILFSPFGVLVVGTFVPIYESIVAVCSVGEQDDTAWLQFWISNATFTYATEFMDDITSHLPSAGEHWYEFEYFFTLWLILPFTDGAALIYDMFTEPYIAPLCTKAKTVLEGWGGFVLTVINSSYLYMVWMTFMTLPEEARRFVVVAVGTVYPIVASTVAITTPPTKVRDDDTYWLTYWACYSVLFVMMDYLENFVGHIRGFYSLCLVATVYLFLPMFGGAREVFRNILVPLSGQYEKMLLHDAYLVRLGVEAKMPEKVRKKVMGKMADVFTREKIE